MKRFVTIVNGWKRHFLIISYPDIFNNYYNARLLFNSCSKRPLGEKCPNTEFFFLVRIFPYLDWIRRDAPYLSIFSPHAGKYGPEKTPYLDTLHSVIDTAAANKVVFRRKVAPNKSSKDSNYVCVGTNKVLRQTELLCR